MAMVERSMPHIVDNLQSSWQPARMAARNAPVPESADVVIVGGGVVGTSAAFHLAEAGAKVVLLERDQLGSGSTSKAAGGFRTQFSDPLNIEIARRSAAAFKAFDTRPGWDIGLHEVGYLFLFSTEEQVEAFAASTALQNELGLETRMVTPGEAKELSPLLEVDGILAASYSPQDGHATPEAVVMGYAFAARRLGAHLATGREVTAIDVSDGRVEGVRTRDHVVKTDTVICAAGAWSRRCGELVGVELPVTPLRRQVLFTEPMDNLPKHLPLTIDFETTFYYHGEGPGLLMGLSDPDELPGNFSTETTDDWIPALLDIAQRRAPRIANTGIRGGWAGLYDMSPDHNAIIGEADGVSRFLYATGFSGHGFLQGPATGELLRDLVLRRPTFADVAPLSVERFARADLRPERNIV
jgi:sarcosine oxidase subunit beta